MNYASLALAALGGTVALFAVGGSLFFLAPFRPKEAMNKLMPVGLVATLLAVLVVAMLFAMIHPGGSGLAEGARYGVLLGLFVVCGFVLHNYVNLNIGLKLALGQAAAYFFQWTIVGIVIGLIYRPLTH